MAYRDTDRAWQFTDIRGNARLVLIALASHRNNKTGACFPSIATLARKLNMTTRTVERHISRLRRSGYIEIGKRKTRAGRLVNDYRLKCLALPTGEPTDLSGITPRVSTGVSVATPTNLSSVTPTELSDKSGIRIRNRKSGIPAAKPQEISLHEKTDTGEEEKTRSQPIPTDMAYQIYEIWTNGLRERGGHAVSLTPREKKQLKDTAANIVALGSSPLEVIAEVVEDWIPFTKNVKEDGLAYQVPLSLDVGFFCRFVRSAVEFTAQNRPERLEREERQMQFERVQAAKKAEWDRRDRYRKYVESHPDVASAVAWLNEWKARYMLPLCGYTEEECDQRRREARRNGADDLIATLTGSSGPMYREELEIREQRLQEARERAEKEFELVDPGPG